MPHRPRSSTPRHLFQEEHDGRTQPLSYTKYHGFSPGAPTKTKGRDDAQGLTSLLGKKTPARVSPGKNRAGQCIQPRRRAHHRHHGLLDGHHAAHMAMASGQQLRHVARPQPPCSHLLGFSIIPSLNIRESTKERFQPRPQNELRSDYVAPFHEYFPLFDLC